MPLQGRLDDAPLHTCTTAVDQANLPQARFVRGVDVVGHDGPDVARRERVQVERPLDWQLDWVSVLHGFS